MLHQTYCDIRFGFMAVENFPPLSKREQMRMGKFIEIVKILNSTKWQRYIGKVY